MVRESTTIVVERNWIWQGTFETEPNEAAWASEAIYFVRALNTSQGASKGTVQVQISPDGIHWTDEGSELPLPAQPDEVTFVRISHFGGWLRLVGQLPQEERINVMVYLNLKA